MEMSVVRPLRSLSRGDRYTATSIVSNATPTELRNAGVNYPQWVRDTYTNFLPTVSSRTIALGNQIVANANAQTPYDRAVAIETWLRQNITYNERIPQPPRDRDSIDWFLFDLRQGYCNYYASAMIVMLRGMASRRVWRQASRKGDGTRAKTPSSCARKTRIRGSRSTFPVMVGSNLNDHGARAAAR